MIDQLTKVQESVAFIESIFNCRPKIGVILGTGLGNLINHVEILESIDYQDIPHFPVSTVESHHGKLHLAQCEGRILLIMQGRFHYYEGYSPEEIVFPVRVMKFLGIDTLLISNAAGGMDASFKTGELMLISDHINMIPNPLVGQNEEAFGPRFVDMFEAYDNGLKMRMKTAAKSLNITLHQGVYCALSGPSLETPAEYKWLTLIGAQAVGMSTTPEVIVAKHMNMKVLGVSVITDLAYPNALKPISIENILKAAAIAEPQLSKLFLQLIAKI